MILQNLGRSAQEVQKYILGAENTSVRLGFSIQVLLHGLAYKSLLLPL